MKTPWFAVWGYWYRPVHLVGWIITAVTFLFCAHTLRFLDSRSHSVSDLFYHAFPIVIPAILVYELIARKSTKSLGK